MSALNCRVICVILPLAIKRLRTSNVANGASASYWEDDFFVSFARKEPWEKILHDVQEVRPSADPTEINDVFFHILKRQIESDFKDESERMFFRVEVLINILKFVPLDDEETELVEKAKALLECSGAGSALEGAEYEIDDLSGSDCGDHELRRMLNALEDCEKGNKGAVFDDRIPKGSLTAADISIIRSALGFGRFEAAWNLVHSQCFPAQFLRSKIAACEWVPKVLDMLKNHPIAVEKEFLRLKTRLFVNQNCEEIFPLCLNFFSSCVLLRIEREERINKIKDLANSYRIHFEKDLKLLDSALGISNHTVMKTGYVLFLKKEYYNRIHQAEIEKLDGWVKSNKEAVSLAVAERLIQTHPDIKKFLQEVHKVLEEEIVPVGDVEKCLLEDAHQSFKGAKSEVEQNAGLILTKLNNRQRRVLIRKESWEESLADCS